MSTTNHKQSLFVANLPKVRASELKGRSWLNTGGKDISLADLRGKIVLLDFWTFCCINCLHVIDELREIEAKYSDSVVVIGVHSPKFVHEADPQALAAAVDRYEVHHPVLDDPELLMWREYTARAWPTLVVVDPEGYIVAHMAGEGHKANIDALVAELIAQHEAQGTLHCGDGPFVMPAPEPRTLRFPSKAVALPDGQLLVADAGHHSLAQLEADGETLIRRIGSGERGFQDGDAETAQFSEPNGLALVPAEVAERVGYDVIVADTVNHALRGVSLSSGAVTTLAGNGRQYMVGGQENEGRLTSPWDIHWSSAHHAFIIAMAGNHTLWSFDPETQKAEWLSGTMNEGLSNGQPDEAWYAQPSGLTVTDEGTDERVWIADSETSALRWLDSNSVVHSAIGQGLFDFGLRDGAADQALMQHPLGVAALPDGSVAIADTYNGAVRRYDPVTDTVTTLATNLSEPSGIVVTSSENSCELLVVESAAHRLTRVVLSDELTGEILNSGAHRTQRPVTDISAGECALSVVFTPAPGQKYDDRWGPSTRLTVSATPENLLLDGAGTTVEMDRTLHINPSVTEGVLHVTAQAASCDNDPDNEFPACHLAQQDWGIPVRVVDGASAALTLPLLG